MINLSVGKKFDIFESVKLQVRVDALNAFNHPNFYFGSYLTLQQGANQGPGQAFSQASFGGGSQINSVEGARVLQGGLRLEF